MFSTILELEQGIKMKIWKIDSWNTAFNQNKEGALTYKDYCKAY